MIDVDIDGKIYRVGKMSARDQFHVMRRIAPLLAGLSEALGSSNGGSDGLLSAIGPVTEALAKMSDSDTNYVLDKCLGVCLRKTDQGTWAKVMASNGEPMFSDMDVATLLNLTREVLQENLSSFFREPPQPNGAGQGATISNLPQ